MTSASASDSPADATDDAVPAAPTSEATPQPEQAEPAAQPQTAPAAASPAPRPAPPTPGSIAPRPLPRAPKPAGAQSAPAAAPTTEPWGRVDADGTVSVREGDAWRVVGEYPDGTPDEALAYFERKYADLAGEVALIEARHAQGGASAHDLQTTTAALRERIVGAAAVGDLAGLERRLDALGGTLESASAEEAEAAKRELEAAIAERTAIVEQIEAIAARDPKSIQWKQTTAEVSALFDSWQAHQSNGPRLARSTGQALWKRFRDARAVIDRHRREFYASMDEQHKSARTTKTRLIERAEALAPRGEDGIGAYRTLLDEWKRSGRAGKKADDALWERFKAAGDALYGARAERERVEVAESKDKIDAKRALLEEAAGVAAEKDNAKARALLTGIQRRWDEIGRIFPREAERAVDDELRKIEQAMRTREDTAWKQNNPETKARQNDMTSQLHEAIEKLADELAAAEATGDARAIAKAKEALDARRAWLHALGG